MHREFIQKLTNLVEANLANEKFGPEELAKEAGMSHSNLNRKLNTISNQNASLFIREVRLKKAKELLLNEDATVAEISYRVGFGSPTYFNKCFHEYFGYAPGEMRNQEQEEETVEQPPETIPKKRNRTKILIAIAVILAVLIPSTYILIKSIVNDKIRDKSVAVLPFKFLGVEVEKQFQADGMMNIIQSYLSKIYDLRVISQTSVEQYRNTEKTAKKIGQELDVAYLLEGRMLMVGDQFKLILQLINTKDDSHEWTTEYAGDRENISGNLSTAAEEIANKIKAKITPEEKQIIRKIPTTNLTAYDFFQKGKEYEEKNTIESIESARLLYQKAINSDSTFALAYVGLARIYWQKHKWEDFYKKNYQEYLDSVLILINLALTYDDKCAEAYLLRGRRYDELNQSDLAVKEYDKAIKYDPNYREAYDAKVGWGRIDPVESISILHDMVNRFHGDVWLLYRLGNTYLGVGFPEMARPYFEQILELEPDSAFYFYSMSQYENAKQNYEAAYRYKKKVNEWDLKEKGMPNDEFLGVCLRAGKYDEAYKVAKIYSETFLMPGKFITVWGLATTVGYCLWQSGDTADAKYYFDYVISNTLMLIKQGRLEDGSFNYYCMASIYAYKGDREKAYYYLDKYHLKKSYAVWDVENFKLDPLFNSIRGEPRFQAILKDVEAKYLAEYQPEHEKVRKWLVSQGKLKPDAK